MAKADKRLTNVTNESGGRGAKIGGREQTAGNDTLGFGFFVNNNPRRRRSDQQPSCD